MRVLIIEDEPIAATRLQNMIKQLHPDFEIVDILDTVESSIEWFNVNIHPDLVFLDIELADGLSFHIFENVKTESPVIFTTAFDNYAIRAFELHCIDYLLKPVNIEKLESAILKLEKQKFVFSANNLEKYLSSLITGVNKQTQSYRSRFLISRPDGYIPVNIDEVAYFFSENEQTFIKTYNNKSYLLSCALDKLEQELDPRKFWRANRAFIVSTESIVKAHNYFNYKIKLELKPATDKEVIISRKKASEFKEWFNQ